MDRSKGIGSTKPAAHSAKPKPHSPNGKAGQRTARPAQKQNSIPSARPASQTTPIKKRDAYNFDKQYRALAETLDVTKAEALFKGMEQRHLPEEQMAKAQHLMVVKSSIFVADKYLDRLQAKKPRRTRAQRRKACSLENLQKNHIKLKTIAGRLARFISA